MDRVSEFYIEIVRSAITNCPQTFENFSNFSEWNNLIALSKVQNSFGFIFYGLKNVEFVPEEIKKQIEKQYKAVLGQQVLQNYYAEQIFEKLSQNQIEYLPLKGYVMRELYPAPDMRTSCDLDFYYNESEREKVLHIMSELGFKHETHSLKDDAFTIAPSVTVEAHFALDDSENEKVDEYCQNALSRLNKKGFELCFSTEDFYIYSIVHASKHFLHGGSGIKSVCDCYVFLNAYPNVSREIVEKELEKLGLLQFEKVYRSLVGFWFGEGELFESSVSIENLSLISNYVLGGGAYGTKLNGGIMMSSSGSSNVRKAKTAYFFKRLFPSKKALAVQYTFLNKYPFLLPVAWLMRVFRAIFKRRKNVRKDFKTLGAIDQNALDSINEIKKIVGFEK